VNTPEQLDKILDQIGEMEGVSRPPLGGAGRKIDRGCGGRAETRMDFAGLLDSCCKMTKSHYVTKPATF
jgi:hypothetical protein